MKFFVVFFLVFFCCFFSVFFCCFFQKKFKGFFFKESETTTKKKEEETGNTIKMGKIGLNKKKDDPSKNYYEAGGANSAGKFDVFFTIF